MPFGVTVLWPTFGAEPYTEIIFMLTLVLPDILYKATGLITTKLDRDHPQGPYFAPMWIIMKKSQSWGVFTASYGKSNLTSLCLSFERTMTLTPCELYIMPMCI